MSKAKFAGSPDSNFPCNVGGGEGLCVVVNENSRANLRAFFLVKASKSIFFFWATSSWAFTQCASLGRNEQYSCTYLSKTIFCYCKSNVQEITSSITIFYQIKTLSERLGNHIIFKTCSPYPSLIITRKLPIFSFPSLSQPLTIFANQAPSAPSHQTLTSFPLQTTQLSSQKRPCPQSQSHPHDRAQPYQSPTP